MVRLVYQMVEGQDLVCIPHLLPKTLSISPNRSVPLPVAVHVLLAIITCVQQKGNLHVATCTDEGSYRFM